MLGPTNLGVPSHLDQVQYSEMLQNEIFRGKISNISQLEAANWRGKLIKTKSRIFIGKGSVELQKRQFVLHKSRAAVRR